jgi:hypothetical protein
MPSEQTRPRYQRSLGAFLVLGIVAMGCIGVLAPGCGGGSSPAIFDEAGADGTAHDGGMGDSAADVGLDHTAVDSGGGDTATPMDSGGDSEPTESGETGTESGAEGGTDSATDTGAEAAPACTGTETACTVGSTAGLCVSGACLPCNSPADNAQCTTAYGAGTTSYVCDSAGSCVAGNCNGDSDCTAANAGEICGLTTAHTCDKCSTDTQCQADPNYGPTTICDPATGGCVASKCTTAGTCSANAGDFCCATGGAADCAGGGTCACVPGNCCTSADCAASVAGSVCGAGGPNVCGKCTLDSQCPTGDVCNTTSGQCVVNNAADCTGTPAATGGKPGTCTPNPADMCCAGKSCIAGTGADACCPGAAGNTYCATTLGVNGATCDPTAFVCTACALVGNNTYIVDPVNGSDQTGTGSGKSTGGTAEATCALKTITRALQLIGTASAPTTIEIVGGAAGPSAATGETFPIVVPTNVTITTESGSGAVTITIPSGLAGFTMSSPASAIQGNTGASLTITTAANGGTNGIVVAGTAGGTGGPTTLANVTITGMLDDGILLNAGILTINPGVTSNNNGTATSAGHGLEVTGGEAIITGSSNAVTSFNGNTAHGILVEGSGYIALTGNTAAGGTVVTDGNALAGVWIQQTPGAAALPTNTITGLVSIGSTAGHGMRIVAGSNVTVRSSLFLGNKGDGVIISAGAGLGAVNSMAGIDLGNTTTNGDNTFQSLSGILGNSAAGLCIDVANGQAPLLAVGNQFQATNCATTAATLPLNPNSCANSAAACSSGVCDLGLTNPAGALPSNNTFNVSKCTQ